ncbi:hypothetical protein Trydic_g21919 [Trypoxylus dichotomus]
MSIIWTSKALYLVQSKSILVILLYLVICCFGWMPDTYTKIVNGIGKIKTTKFIGNSTHPDHFIVLYQDNTTVLLGDPDSEICLLKGKFEDDCQNYIRILVPLPENQILVCGTNSYKPLCRYYSVENGEYIFEKEVDGRGKCPYDPEHNSTAVFSNGQLYSATVADLSGGDPLIYREPQRTELSNLKQLNGPNFVSSIPFGEYVFFFYRETAVEYINCGKVIYSRVARVCKNDKGGPYKFSDRWTSFLKTRLNCSVPGEYPFYFDEIQSTTDIISGKYGFDDEMQVIYGTLTTPSNAIGGSAICAYSMKDILAAFEGTFKHQETMNSNWLPIPEDKLPEERPGKCVRDSRVLPENIVNFVKTHSLMENAVPALFGKPILIRVSQEYRFTAIAVEPQVETLNGDKYDILYVGTDDGKVLKVVNIVTASQAKAIVLSENVILPNNAPVKQLKIIPGSSGNIIVVGRDEVRLANLNHCSQMSTCKDCLTLQDPHCAWDYHNAVCENIDNITSRLSFVQDIKHGDEERCRIPPNGNKKIPIYKNDAVNNVVVNSVSDDGTGNTIDKSDNAKECEEAVESNEIPTGCAVQQRLVIAGTLHFVLFIACSLCLVFGFVIGYFISKRFQTQPQYPNSPFIEQHNHLDRLPPPRANKSVNLNVPQNPPPKKDNLDVSKDLNIASDGTLQKIKKTYI